MTNPVQAPTIAQVVGHIRETEARIGRIEFQLIQVFNRLDSIADILAAQHDSYATPRSTDRPPPFNELCNHCGLPKRTHSELARKECQRAQRQNSAQRRHAELVPARTPPPEPVGADAEPGDMYGPPQ
jgi:protein-disulfide isomerase-like protein with CxxC motif